MARTGRLVKTVHKKLHKFPKQERGWDHIQREASVHSGLIDEDWIYDLEKQDMLIEL